MTGHAKRDPGGGRSCTPQERDGKKNGPSLPPCTSPPKARPTNGQVQPSRLTADYVMVGSPLAAGKRNASTSSAECVRQRADPAPRISPLSLRGRGVGSEGESVSRFPIARDVTHVSGRSPPRERRRGGSVCGFLLACEGPRVSRSLRRKRHCGRGGRGKERRAVRTEYGLGTSPLRRAIASIRRTTARRARASWGRMGRGRAAHDRQDRPVETRRPPFSQFSPGLNPPRKSMAGSCPK